jgi:hypothetical protein
MLTQFVLLSAGQGKMFFQKAEQICALLKNKKHSAIFLLLMTKMKIILAIINSNEKVHSQSFRTFARVTTDLIVRNLKWFRIIPTVHTVSWFHCFSFICECLEFIIHNSYRKCVSYTCVARICVNFSK